MKIWHSIYNVVRSILVTAILGVAVVYILLYLVVSMPSIQSRIRQTGSSELGMLLGTNVSIGDINISPFNQLVLYDVLVPDEKGDTILFADKIGVGFSMFNLIARRQVVFTYAELIGVDGRLKRTTPDAPLNIQFIIDALSPKQKDKPPTYYDLNIRNIVIRRSRFSYDILSSDTLSGEHFDANHVRLDDIRADISLPRIRNNDYHVDLRRLSFKEAKGFVVKNFSVEAVVNDSCIGLSNVKIELPNSLIVPNDVMLRIDGLSNVLRDVEDINVDLQVADSYVTLSDFEMFSPVLKSFTFPINFSFNVNGTLHKLAVPVFSVKSTDGRLSMGVRGTVDNIMNHDLAYADINYLHLSADANVVATIVSSIAGITPEVGRIISACGNIDVNGALKGNLAFANFAGNVTTSVGNLTLNGVFANQRGDYYDSYTGRVETENFDIGKLLARENLLGTLACNIDIDIKNMQSLYGNINGNFGHIDLKGYRYNDIAAKVVLDKKTISGRIDVDDENGSLSVEGNAFIDGANTVIDVVAAVNEAELSKLNLTDKFHGRKLSLALDAFFSGNDLNNFSGNVSLHNVTYCDSLGTGLHVSNFRVDADNDSQPKTVRITSDILNGNISGQYDVYTLSQSVGQMLARPFPAVFGNVDEEMDDRSASNFERRLIPNNLYFNFVIDDADELADMFNWPVKPLSAVTVEGFVTDSNHSLYLLVDAPYLQQKNKLIEGTRLQVSLNNRDNNLQVDANTIMPLKKGKLALSVTANGVNDRIDSNVEWTVDNQRAYSGEVSVSSLLVKDTVDNALSARIDVNPTEILFNDTAWVIHPSHIDVEMENKRIAVNNVLVTCEKQFIKINGMASDCPEDEITLELSDINLDYVFETLSIDNVMFGGRATGLFYASDLFSGVPRMYTRGLFVNGLSYNNAVFGDAKILSSWLNEDKCVTIQADVAQQNGEQTKIDGKIFVSQDSLYFDFQPRRANIAFLKPFMSAFSSDIGGEASGHVILYGTFKNIDITGDVYADSLRMKIDYTNVYYSASDSVKMRPGIISMDNVELRDPMGHTAYLSGTVTHECFHNAAFDFKLTNARDFLGFDITQKMSPEWYGRMFGNGSAFISGQPGVVNIDINMATADNSSFTYVLSDTKVATEYNFITFVDRNKGYTDDELSDTRPERVRAFLRKQEEEDNGLPSLFNINLMIEVTPVAQMNLVMDPAGGDKIRATGSGSLRIGYNNADEDMSIFGTYTLARGNYNFTLQDIIIKDFTIREGSSLTFNGSPLSAVMNIEALYSLYANLTDLDESFATDGDLNRTNVPVNAILRLQGDISAPDISFDLEFPTLTSDVYRKVMSIISTEDMMNRQIIYLLALNSFYTPDYMTDSSSSNELASVASSTISSHLSNLLGQMSENWSISPNFRSDNGDFSDIEVELALSSQLLNNRLLFNGNFGYRDNSLDTRNSNFIGDFDIEYLLTKNGNIRLKAYNHYNDQNYYLRSALTTQGVGVVFKHDFNGWHDLLWRRRRKKSAENEKIVPTDSLVSDDGVIVRERVETSD